MSKAGDMKISSDHEKVGDAGNKGRRGSSIPQDRRESPATHSGDRGGNSTQEQNENHVKRSGDNGRNSIPREQRESRVKASSDRHANNMSHEKQTTVTSVSQKDRFTSFADKNSNRHVTVNFFEKSTKTAEVGKTSDASIKNNGDRPLGDHDSPDGGKGLEKPDGFDDPRLQDLQTKLDGIKGTRLEEWSKLTPEGRQNALQEINNQIANVYEFQPNQVTLVAMSSNYELGAFDPDTGNIELNNRFIGDNGDISKNYQDGIETLAHESRHAYQEHLVNRLKQDPASLSDADKLLAQQWSDNNDNYINPYDDFEAYCKQPIEADAEGWATKVFKELQGDL